MAAPRILITDLPEQMAPVDTDLLVVQNGPTTKKMTVGRLTTQNTSALGAHLAAAVDAHDASAISAVPNAAPIVGADVQAQLAQAASAINTNTTAINTNTTGLANHIANPAAHAATAVTAAPTAPITGATVQAELNSAASLIAGNTTNITANQTALANHAASTTAHAASAITVLPVGNLDSTNVQAALTELQASLDTAINSLRRPVFTQAATAYTPVPTDENTMLLLNNAAAITITLTTFAIQPFPTGAEVDFLWYGVGQPTFVAGSGATVRATPGLKLRAQYSAATAKKIGTNEWVVIGDLA